MNRRTILIAVTLVAGLSFADSAKAAGPLDFFFSLAADPGRGEGISSGKIFGLTDNTMFQSPTAIELMQVGGVKLANPVVFNQFNSEWWINEFSVENGQIVYANALDMQRSPTGNNLVAIRSTANSSYDLKWGWPNSIELSIDNPAHLQTYNSQWHNSVSFAPAAPAAPAPPMPACIAFAGAIALRAFRRKSATA